jgi:hypothetical protein
MKFRKKPVVIEAFQVPASDDKTRQLPPHWLLEALIDGGVTAIPGGGLDIKTLEGSMRANVCDWVIQGVKGELYPCRPDIFAATYEAAE